MITQRQQQEQIKQEKTRRVYPISLGTQELKALDLLQKKLECSRADAIRESIREYADQVKGMEVVKLRSLSRKLAKKEIMGYLRKHDRAWSDEIADELRLDIRFVSSILNELWEQGNSVEPVSASSSPD